MSSCQLTCPGAAKVTHTNTRRHSVAHSTHPQEGMTTRGDTECAALGDDCVAVLGGWGPSDDFSNLAECYSPSKGSWRRLASMNRARGESGYTVSPVGWGPGDDLRAALGQQYYTRAICTKFQQAISPLRCCPATASSCLAARAARARRPMRPPFATSRCVCVCVSSVFSRA